MKKGYFGFVALAAVIVAALALVAPRPAVAWPTQAVSVNTLGTDNTTTPGLKLHKYANSVQVLLPTTITSSYLTVQGSNDNSAWYDIYESGLDNSGARVKWKTPTGTAIRGAYPLPNAATNFIYLRGVFNDNQAAPRAIGWIQK